jgi:predicted AAA+ superfamily ATPase
MEKSKFLKRDLMDQIVPLLGRKEIICVRGPRQAGKTTILKALEELTTGRKAFLNMDNPENRAALQQSPLDLVVRLNGNAPKLTLFLDEIQRVPDSGEKLKLIFDEKDRVKMLVSGSSSLELKTNVLSFLVGRMFLFDLLTFSFGEFLNSKDSGLYKIFSAKNASLIKFMEKGGPIEKPAFNKEFTEYLNEYLVFGGFPEVIKSKSKKEKITVLKNITSLYLEKDIVSFFKIEDTSKFESVLKMLAFNCANILNASSIGSDAGLTTFRLLEYLNMLSNTYIIELVNPFHKNMTTELKKSKKLYFLDLGQRNALLDNFSDPSKRTDSGQLAENFVFRELKTKGYKIKYWRTSGKAEVDFVIETKTGIVPIEVKLGRARLGRSFYSFIDTYKPDKAIVTTSGTFKKQIIGKTTVYFVPIFYF